MAAPVPGAQAAPRAFAATPTRMSTEPRRQQVHTFVPRRADPTSEAILAELAALGLVEADESD